MDTWPPCSGWKHDMLRSEHSLRPRTGQHHPTGAGGRADLVLRPQTDWSSLMVCTTATISSSRMSFT